MCARPLCPRSSSRNEEPSHLTSKVLDEIFCRLSARDSATVLNVSDARHQIFNFLATWTHDHVRRRVDGLEQVSAGLRDLGEHEDVVQGIVEAVERHLGFEFGAVLILNDDTNRLEPRALSRQGKGADFLETDKNYISSRMQHPGKGIAAWVARTGDAVCLGDVRSDHRYLGLREDIVSELCVPLRVGTRIVGVFNTETVNPRAYGKAEQRALEQIGVEVARAVELERKIRHAVGCGQAAQRPAESRTVRCMVDYVVQCAWCRRFKCDTLDWRVSAPNPHAVRANTISHGICPSCSRRVMED